MDGFRGSPPDYQKTSWIAWPECGKLSDVLMTLLKEATDFFPEKLEQLEQIEWNMAELWQVTHVNELDFMSWLQVGTVRFDSVSEILPFWHEMIL